jgi:hypothetical protein
MKIFEKARSSRTAFGGPWSRVVVRTIRMKALLAGALVSWAVAAPVGAAPIVFDFNVLSDGASNTAVRNYMQSVVSAAVPGGTIAVTGALAERNYTGDGHVVGTGSGSSFLPLTLGTTEHGVPNSPNGALDTFIVNSTGTDRITLVFSFPIFSISFDYEIFPNGSCPRLSNCSSVPDFRVYADGSLEFLKLGVVPGDPSLPNTRSATSNPELAPQFLGRVESLSLPGVFRLEFVDWPERIGIDNLTINRAPEPGSFFLLVAAGAAWVGLRRRPPCSAARSAHKT